MPAPSIGSALGQLDGTPASIVSTRASLVNEPSARRCAEPIQVRLFFAQINAGLLCPGIGDYASVLANFPDIQLRRRTLPSI
jgi:hypothetical protein